MKNLLRLGILLMISSLFVGFLLFKMAPRNTNALISTPSGETNPDAEIYAERMGLSLDEVNRQFRISDTAGILQADLIANESDTFAGLWIEHSPKLKVVVLFTGNARKTIKPYLEKEYMTKELVDVLEVRKAKVSLAELERVTADLNSSLTDMRIRFELELDELENNIKLGIGEEDKATFDLAVRSGSVQVPRYVVIKIIPQLGKIKPSLGDHFPQTINVPNGYLDLPLLQGKLVLENGCIRLHAVNYWEDNSFLIIWDPRFSTRTADSVVQVIDSGTGKVLVSVGNYVEMGNNGVEMGNNGEIVNLLKEPIPEECTGPYISVGEFIKKIDYP
jgi:hypothetical protein